MVVGQPVTVQPVEDEAAVSQLTMRDVQRHNSRDDMWLVIAGNVYDCTTFQEEHPGGAKILRGIAGKDATVKFDQFHRRAMLNRYQKLVVGAVAPDSYTATPATARRRGFRALMRLGK